MIWVALFGAVGAVVNAIWAFYRWRKDTTYIAWSCVNTKRPGSIDTYAVVQSVNLTSAGTAHAYDVKLFAQCSLNSYGVGDASHMLVGESIEFEVRTNDEFLTGWRIEYRTRPGRDVVTELWNPDMTLRLDKPAWRERVALRVGNRIAGRNLADPGA